MRSRRDFSSPSRTNRSALRPRFRRKRYRVNWFQVALVLVIVYTSVVFIQQQLIFMKLKAQADQLESKLNRLRSQTNALSEEAKRLNDPQYIEALARESLGMIKEGEAPYIIASPDQ